MAAGAVIGELPSRPRILVVALRRLGDVLLATPLVRSLRNAWPEATLDVLVFAGTEGILAGNPDIDAVKVWPVNGGAMAGVRAAARLVRRYDLAVSTQGGDRPTILACLAGRRRAGVLDDARSWKRHALTRSVVSAPSLHRVDELLHLADVLGIPRVRDVVPPRGPLREALRPRPPYAVIHPMPMFAYKRWTGAGWLGLATTLAERGLHVVVTGGSDPGERAALDVIFPRAGTLQRLDGQLAWPEVAALLAGAKVYVGPDTAVTHLAAAVGCRTVALYGPTDPRRWGPWPQGGLASPWSASAALQRRGNVWLVQNPLPCLPCQQEGCDRRLDSASQCLDELSLGSVVAAVDCALAAGEQAARPIETAGRGRALQLSGSQ
jgi:heptosyltransferase-3